MREILHVAAALELCARKIHQLVTSNRRLGEPMSGADDGTIEGKSLLTEEESGEGEWRRREAHMAFGEVESGK